MVRPIQRIRQAHCRQVQGKQVHHKMRRLDTAHKILFVAALLILLFPLMGVSPVFAQDDAGVDIGGAVGKFFLEIIDLIARFFETLIRAIAYVFLLAANALLAAALQFNFGISQDPVARLGFNIVLGIANMGFIVALVVIAFSTMLRREGFGYKAGLPRLIIAALLINFGFFIVTNVFIEPVNAVTSAIFNAGGFNPAGSFIEKFTKGFGDWITGPPVDIKEFGASAAAILARVLFTAALNFLAVITLFAFAAMLFIRYITMVILIILLPLAWIAWIFPNLKIPGGGNPWNEWWETFIRWLLFAPFAMLFLWIALKLSTEQQLYNEALKNITAEAGGDVVGSGIADIAGMIAIIGILLGGLIVSNKMGITGAGYAMAVAKRGGDWAKFQGKQVGARFGGRVLKSKPVNWATQKAQGFGSQRGWALNKITAPVRMAGRGAARGTIQAETARQQAVRKKFEGLPPYRIAEMYDGLNDYEKMVAAHMMVEKGYQWELPEGWIDDVAKWERQDLYKKRGMEKFKLDMWDKGIFSETIAAQQELEEAEERGAPQEEIARRTRKFEGSMEDSLNVVGERGLSGMDKRLLSKPGTFKGWRRDKKTGRRTQQERYIEQLTRTAIKNHSGGLNSWAGSLRGDGRVYLNTQIEGFMEGKPAVEVEGAELIPERGGWNEQIFVDLADRAHIEPPPQGKDAAPAEKRRWLEDNWRSLWPQVRQDILRDINLEIADIREDTTISAKKRQEALADLTRRQAEIAADNVGMEAGATIFNLLSRLYDSRRGGFAFFTLGPTLEGGGPPPPTT